MNTVIKIILIAMFTGCLYKMPYSYYQMNRFVALVGFSILAYRDYMRKYYLSLFISIPCVVLFNPFFKVTFKRDIWQEIDLILICILILWIVIEWVYLLYEKGKAKKEIKI